MWNDDDEWSDHAEQIVFHHAIQKKKSESILNRIFGCDGDGLYIEFNDDDDEFQPPTPDSCKNIFLKNIGNHLMIREKKW